MLCAVFKLVHVCYSLKREMNGSPQLLVHFVPNGKEQEVHKCIHPKHFRVGGIKVSNVVTKETSQILLQTLAFTEIANKFSQSLRGLIYRCRI